MSEHSFQVGLEMGRVMMKVAVGPMEGFGQALEGAGKATPSGVGRTLDRGLGAVGNAALGAGRTVAAVPRNIANAGLSAGYNAGRGILGAGQAQARALGQGVAAVGRGAAAVGDSVNRNVIDPAVRGADYAGQVGSNVYQAAQGRPTRGAQMAPGLPGQGGGPAAAPGSFMSMTSRGSAGGGGGLGALAAGAAGAAAHGLGPQTTTLANPGVSVTPARAAGRAAGYAAGGAVSAMTPQPSSMDMPPRYGNRVLQNTPGGPPMAQPPAPGSRGAAGATGYPSPPSARSAVPSPPASASAPAASPYGRTPQTQSQYSNLANAVPPEMMERYRANVAAGRTKMSPAEALGYYQKMYSGSQRVPGAGIMQNPGAGRSY